MSMLFQFINNCRVEALSVATTTHWPIWRWSPGTGCRCCGTPVAASEAIQERIDGSKLVVLPAARHLSNIEQSGAFDEALMDFLPK